MYVVIIIIIIAIASLQYTGYRLKEMHSPNLCICVYALQYISEKNSSKHILIPYEDN